MLLNNHSKVQNNGTGKYGARGCIVVKALRYKPEGSEFETR
jgi:hypothetical protein